MGETVRGASHRRARQRRQDAIRWQVADETDWGLIMAVSDGHGSPTNFRSHLGANRAVRAMEIEFNRLLESNPELDNLSAVKRLAVERLPQLLVRSWEQMVAAHLRRSPITEGELAQLSEKRGPNRAAKVRARPQLAYGATVLGALVTEAFIVYVQLGDGDIITATHHGAVLRPLPEDGRLHGDQTTSLCTPEAWRDVRVGFQALSDNPPRLILMATDGYANSFRDEASFIQVGPDLLELIRENGLDWVQQEIPGWLNEASQSGSGDDVTLGLIYRLEHDS
jgi:hypothetical protein